MSTEFYFAGGNVPADSPSYVVRRADGILLNYLTNGDFCYVLTSRQMGKSSLMTRAAAQLRDQGTAVAVLDLSAQGFLLSADQWYNGLLDQMANRLNIAAEVDRFCSDHSDLSPLQRWLRALREVVLESHLGKVVVFIDEIDVVRKLPFSADELFTSIRACYNARSEDAAYKRLSFCLLGVATPSELVSNTELTPFNVGVRIDLPDFTREEAAQLEPGLGIVGKSSVRIMDRIYYWTRGHPYLTQRLCMEVSDQGSAVGNRIVDQCVHRLFFTPQAQRQDSNLAFVLRHMLPETEEDRAALLTLYSRILRGQMAPDTDTSVLAVRMKMAGVTRTESGRLLIRNRIYERAFGETWVSETMPGAEYRRQRAAYRQGAVRAATISAAIVCAMASLMAWALVAQFRSNRYSMAATAATQAAGKRLAEANRASYALSMNLIQREWDEHNIAHVLDLLEATKSSEYRGFEWGYWNHLCHTELFTLSGHSWSVNTVSFSPDGGRIATGCRDATITVWNSSTGARLIKFKATQIDMVGNRSGVTSLQFTPDGKQIVAGCDNTLAIWDSASGRHIKTIGDNTSHVNAVSLSPDAKRLVAAVNYTPDALNRRGKTMAVIWDLATGREVMKLDTPTDTLAVKSVQFSADGRSVITGNYDRTIRVWDSKTGRNTVTIRDPNCVIASVAFSPDGNRIVSGGKRPFVPEAVAGGADEKDESSVSIWDSHTGKRLLRIRGYIYTVKSVAFSPDGRFIATSSFDNTARVWDSKTGREDLTLRGHTDYVVAAAFSPDGSRLATGSYDQTGRIWELSSLRRRDTISTGGARVTSLAVASDRLIAGLDRSAVNRDPSTGRESIAVPTVAVQRVGVACASIFSLDTGRKVRDLIGHLDWVTSAAASTAGDRVITGSYDSTARIWSAAGVRLFTLNGSAGAVNAVAFSRDGSLAATADSGDADHGVKLWDTRTGNWLKTLSGHTGQVTCIAFSRDRVFTAGVDKTAIIWDLATGRQCTQLKGHSDKIECVAASPDGRWVVTGADDNTAIVWNAVSGEPQFTLKGHTDNITAVVFSPDGGRIVTGSDDGTTRVWEAETGQLLLVLKGHTSAVKAVAFSPTGNCIYTGSWDKTIRIWRSSAGWIK